MKGTFDISFTFNQMWDINWAALRGQQLTYFHLNFTVIKCNFYSLFIRNPDTKRNSMRTRSQPFVKSTSTYTYYVFGLDFKWLAEIRIPMYIYEYIWGRCGKWRHLLLLLLIKFVVVALRESATCWSKASESCMQIYAN